MLPQELIRKKRDGKRLADDEIAALVAGIADGQGLADAQVGALAMALFLNGLDRAECVALTRAMTASGDVLSWKSENLPGPIVDKHSTGGIGDKTSLVLAPWVAACGGYVPMISGRGLGHTGGTLDKLESIPGYDAKPDNARFRSTVREAGCAIIGQTANLAPADKRLYAIRDVTATVESIGLITASILSKKLAAGLDALVMDVKFGSGAFMAEFPRARELASSIVEVARGAGLKTRALLTDMDSPLGTTAGNALEVREAVAFLKGTHEARLAACTKALAAEMLDLSGIAPRAQATEKLDAALASGAAAERFARMIASLGGPGDFIERIDAYLPKAPIVRAVAAPRRGFVAAIMTREVGLAVLELGGGRTDPAAAIDPAVGFAEIAPLGAEIGPDRPLALMHARDEASAARAARTLAAAYTVGDAPPPTAPVVRETLGA
ncbi:MAG: thymidine phosphorylase [Alphaproteobacteria bacterium]|nr:thymidine phosphorylase [Alphaproteobacteria bacterium]